MIENPCIIILKHNFLIMTYDSRNRSNPFKIEGNFDDPRKLYGMVHAMERELLIKGISLVNKKQMELLVWRPKKNNL